MMTLNHLSCVYCSIVIDRNSVDPISYEQYFPVEFCRKELFGKPRGNSFKSLSTMETDDIKKWSSIFGWRLISALVYQL